MMTILLVLAAAGGICMAFQSPTNTELSRHIGNLQATTVSFATGVMILLILTAVLGNGDITLLAEASWWQLLGGVYGVFVVLTVTYAVPHLGTALTLTVIMLGQLSMGIVIDTFGMIGVVSIPVKPDRVLGCLAVLAGIIIVYFGKRKKEPGNSMNRASVGAVVCTFMAGVGGAVQSPTNVTLAGIIGSIEASLISFIIGLIFILAVTFVSTRGHPIRIDKNGFSWWMFIGGVYGAAVVFINVVTIPYLGVAVQVAAVMLGQLWGGMLIDNFGLLKSQKMEMNCLRYIGMIVIMSGVVIAALSRNC